MTTSMIASASSSGVFTPSFPSSSSSSRSTSSSSEQIPTTLNLPSEVLGIIGSFDHTTLTGAVPEKAKISSDGLVNDLMIAKQNAWQGFADYLRGRPNSFSGKIFKQLISQKGNETIEQIVQKTFLEAKKKITQNYQIFVQIQRDLQIQILPVQGLDPNNLEIEYRACERIDNIAEEYLPGCEEFIIKCIKKNRHLPEPNPTNSTANNYIQQLEREGLLNAEILKEAFVCAAALGHLDCLNAIISNQLFAKISAADLELAFFQAARFNHLDCLNAIMHSDRFAEISADYLASALIRATANGNPDCLNAIIHSDRFAEISADYLGRALWNAAEYDQHCLKAIIHSNRFAEISAADLGWALIGRY